MPKRKSAKTEEPKLTRAELAKRKQDQLYRDHYQKGYINGYEESRETLQAKVAVELDQANIRRQEQQARINAINAVADMAQRVCRTLECLANDFAITAPEPAATAVLRRQHGVSILNPVSPSTSDNH